MVSALLLMLVICTGVVFAVAYVALQLTSTASVQNNPKVCFIKWSDGSKANTFDYAVNIFPSITTVDANITYGVWNWDTATHTTSMRWYSLTNSGNIASLGLKVYNSTSTIYEQYWASVPSLPTSWVVFNPTPKADGKYTISLNITATASPSGSSVFTFDMKVENP